MCIMREESRLHQESGMCIKGRMCRLCKALVINKIIMKPAVRGWQAFQHTINRRMKYGDSKDKDSMVLQFMRK